MRFRAQMVSLEIESMRDCRASPEIESMPAGRGSQTSVDQEGLVTTYKIFPAKLLIEASGRIGDKKI